MSQLPGDFQRVAIAAPGLLGGSLALALAARRPCPAIRVWGRRAEPLETLRAAIAPRADLDFAASTDFAEAAAGADLIVLATPVGAMRETLLSLLDSEGPPAPGAVVTDMGSVKGSVVAELEPLCAARGLRFVGSHPMAGSEQKGAEHASDALFAGAACLLTPTAATDAAALERVDAFWRTLGCRTHRLAPGAHDRAVARISHLPHVLAATLVATALSGDGADAGNYAAGGFRDTTRVASGPPEMWAEILLENRGPLSALLLDFREKIGELLVFLEAGDRENLVRFLSQAKERRDALYPRPPAPAANPPLS
ncbi:MAG: prephenate dehydrogenase/arogenate dehydrogenase family protein [Akkermansiaceae bacterium]|nr:prephenate dehydrogenase/arogenate dehydrogenase family protein [Akkermansiaceae bacterium]